MTRSGLTDPLSRPPLSVWQQETARGDIQPLDLRTHRVAFNRPANVADPLEWFASLACGLSVAMVVAVLLFIWSLCS